jgi:DNA-binding PadR family transcriptional regulator
MLVLLTGAPRLSGYPISRAAMVGSGNVYLILARLERLGWVSSEWETPNPLPEGAGRRRFYSLTLEGRKRVLEVLGLEDREHG